jgi:predicted RNase H-like nuclease (RuvC/YqgF family)
MQFNEFPKEHRKVEEQQAAIKQLESTVAQYEHLRSTVAQQERRIQFLTVSLKEQVSQIQKISAELATERVRSTGGLEVGNSRPDESRTFTAAR